MDSAKYLTDVGVIGDNPRETVLIGLVACLLEDRMLKGLHGISVSPAEFQMAISNWHVSISVTANGTLTADLESKEYRKDQILMDSLEPGIPAV